MNLIIFRQYLDSPKSFEDLARLKKEFSSNIAFQRNIIILLQAGKKSFSDAALKYCKSNDPPQLGIINVYHLSEEKAGLTLPLVYGLEIARRVNPEKAIISDSDFQFSVGTIVSCISDFHEKSKAVYLPFRKKRQLWIEGYKLNRYVIEDLENNFVYYRHSLSKKYDFQSGLILLNNSLLQELPFQSLSKWAGGLELVQDIITRKGQLITGMTIETIPQIETSISYIIQLEKFKELERSFNCTIKDVVIHAI